MRPDEVMRMTWTNIHWDRSAIFIPSGKTFNARRFVPLSERLPNLLRERQENSKSDWVFPGKTEDGRRASIAKQYRNARKAAGLGPEIALYCARHTFATNLLSETGDLALFNE